MQHSPASRLFLYFVKRMNQKPNGGNVLRISRGMLAAGLCIDPEKVQALVDRMEKYGIKIMLDEMILADLEDFLNYLPK